ncbi:MAG: hypothetical protein AB8B48_08735 [Pseudomonadales bacterium]
MRRIISSGGIAIVAFLFAQSLIAEEAPAITLGNGEKNWIIVDDVKRDESILTFSEVHIDGNGWLVIHPFEDGKPNGDKYVASTYLSDGKNSDVDIEVYKGLSSGEMFIVMLHRDVNENKVLDFVFIDDTAVMDTAVFEGSKMIAHAIPAP